MANSFLNGLIRTTHSNRLSPILFLILMIQLFPFVPSSFANHLIIINGGSCSGKTSVTKALFKMLSTAPDRKDHWSLESIDDVVRKLAIGQEDYGEDPEFYKRLPMNAQMFNGLHQRIQRKVASGESVVLDHCFMDDAIFRNALYHFRELPVYFVKISASYEAGMARLERRNQGADESEHRMPVCVQQHFGRMEITRNLEEIIEHSYPRTWGLPTHHQKQYNLEIDTSSKTIEEVADIIYQSFLAAKSQELRPGNFFQVHHEKWVTPDFSQRKFIKVNGLELEFAPDIPYLIKSNKGKFAEEYGLK